MRTYGEIVCAWIVPKPGQSLTEDDVREFCRANMSHFKAPAHIRFVEEMPATVTGKLRKYLMQEAMCRDLGLSRQLATKQVIEQDAAEHREAHEVIVEESAETQRGVASANQVLLVNRQ